MYNFAMSVLMIFFLVMPATIRCAMINPHLSQVEKVFLQKSGRQSSYEGEKIAIIETDNVCCLGKLTALRFIEWVQENPEGVIALPTGKTPELFIEYLSHYKQNWKEPTVQKDLVAYGIKGESFPETSNLKFVQLDEFYPVDVNNKNSFTYYINKYYIELLDLEPQNVLSLDFASVGILQEKGVENVFPGGRVDFTLLDRKELKNQREKWQRQALQEAEALCQVYEKCIENWGGIGFFLGGIGPDGHIAFNMEGSSHSSQTRLVKLNYKTAAAAAVNLGGIEYSRDKTAVTIGLDTITFNRAATWIILASGEAKAPVVASAVQTLKSKNNPATVLQGVPGARFYLTKGAASLLEARRVEDVKQQPTLSQEMIDDIIINLALNEGKSLDQLTSSDFSKQKRAQVLYQKFSGHVDHLTSQVKQRLIAKIEKGLELPKQENILHTSPHHDDVMLSYHPLLKPLIKQNNNHFVYVTSGFNSVTDTYITKLLNRFSAHEVERYKETIFNTPYSGLIERYTQAAKDNDQIKMNEIEGFIMLQNICKVCNIQDVTQLNKKISYLVGDYFQKKIPGEKDDETVRLLKGAMRESESDRMLALNRVPLSNISHMRSKFYTGDYFTPLPTIEDDAEPLRVLYDGFKPSIITVAFDPEGTGPDTHYKVLQVVAEALRLEGSKISPKIWGYRNVWHRFSPSETTRMIAVSEEDMKELHKNFMYSFSTQKAASFPSYQYDGPFSEFAKQVQREQFDYLKLLLGSDFFSKHYDNRVREAQGFIFIKEMDSQEFLSQAQDLKSRIEL